MVYAPYGRARRTPRQVATPYNPPLYTDNCMELIDCFISFIVAFCLHSVCMPCLDKLVSGCIGFEVCRQQSPLFAQ